MTCGVFGPGLVGSFLGAAAGAPWVIAGPSGRPRAHLVRFIDGVRTWNPAVLPTPPDDVPLLVATRVHRTPWEALPSDALVAQNGLGQPRQQIATCMFAVDLDADGVLHATGPRPRMIVGPLTSAWSPVLTAWKNAGIHVEQVTDPRSAQWEKAILNATVGPLCLGTGRTMAAVWSDAELRQLTLAATNEGETLARAIGVFIAPGIEARASSFFSAVGDHHPSVVRDAGELPWVLGVLLQTADNFRVPAPALRRIAAMVARHSSTEVQALHGVSNLTF
jgi:ketopantoate reductase